MGDYKKLEKRMEDYIALVDEHIITSSTDLHGNITSVSKAFCRISKYSEAELLGQNHRIVRHEDMPKELYDDMWEHLSSGRAWSGEIKNKAKDGSSYWVKADISPIWNEDGEKIGYTAIRQDITDKKALEELSTRDYLTGLYNRLKLDKILNYEITQSHRYETPLSIIILDIDYFKNVNDTCGHQAGDEVLKEVAQICQSTCRHSDSIGRWGGEEFLIVLPKTDLHGALIEAERLRDAIDRYSFSIVDHKTASLGVSQLIELDTLGSFIERADNALYRAKENGRNRVIG